MSAPTPDPDTVECHEGVTRGGEFQPCEKPAVAQRIDEEGGGTYPVCIHHTRKPMVNLPRPAAVSEEQLTTIIADTLDRLHVPESADRESVEMDAEEIMRDLLPHLAPGQSEAEVRADEREKALNEFADTLGVNVGDDDSEWWQGYRQGQREALHKAVAFARTAPAEDGAE